MELNSAIKEPKSLLDPEIDLHYDPFKEASGRNRLCPTPRISSCCCRTGRVVIECDGVQHYADDLGRASPQRHAEIVAEDRGIRLHGYEAYRFGGQGLREEARTMNRLRTFFDALTARYSGGA